MFVSLSILLHLSYNYERHFPWFIFFFFFPLLFFSFFFFFFFSIAAVDVLRPALCVQKKPFCRCSPPPPPPPTTPAPPLHQPLLSTDLAVIFTVLQSILSLSCSPFYYVALLSSFSLSPADKLASEGKESAIVLSSDVSVRSFSLRSRASSESVSFC